METTIVADATITPIRRAAMMWISLIARAMCLEILFADHTPPLPM
jgi:hypothetical protein